MISALRLHEQVQKEIEWHDAKFHRTGFYPHFGNGGLYVTVFTEHLEPGTIWEEYVKDLESYLERYKESISEFTKMTIIGHNKYVE